MSQPNPKSTFANRGCVIYKNGEQIAVAISTTLAHRIALALNRTKAGPKGY